MNNTLFNLKNMSFYLICIFFFVNLFIYPQEIAFATKTGILLWYNNILPSIFAFIIFVNIMTSSNIINYSNQFINKLFYRCFGLPFVAFISMLLGLLSGYPLGAKITSELLENKKLSLHQANKVICFSNCCGPMFIISAIGINMFNNITYGYILLFSQILTILTIALILCYYKKSSISTECNTTNPIYKKSLSSIINSSIINSIDTILNICGIITFFCIITKICEIYKIEEFIFAFLNNLPYFKINFELLKSLIYGMLEITNGIYLISLSNLSSIVKVLLTSFLINFGGICVLMQTRIVTSKSGINLKFYFFVKIISGMISVIYTYLLYKLFIE